MKRLFLFPVLLGVCFQLFAAEVEQCSLSGNVVIPAGDVWVCNSTLSIADGTTIEGQFIAKNAVALTGSFEIKENAIVTFDGGFTLSGNANLQNRGILHSNNDVSMTGSSKFYNYGVCLFTNASFTGVRGVTFSNEANATFNLDNDDAHDKSMTFGAEGANNSIPLGIGDNGIFFKANSTFVSHEGNVTIYADVDNTGAIGDLIGGVTGDNDGEIDGTVVVYDANLTIYTDDDGASLYFKDSSKVEVIDTQAPYDEGRFYLSPPGSTGLFGATTPGSMTLHALGEIVTTDFAGDPEGTSIITVQNCDGLTGNQGYVYLSPSSENRGSNDVMYASCSTKVITYNDQNAFIKDFLNWLPIELTHFAAAMNNNTTVHVTWETATETNNDYFTLYRSLDGRDFEEITTVSGAGSSTETHSYEVYDNITECNTMPLSPVYYKLKQTDYNGANTQSKIIVVNTNHSVDVFKIEKLYNTDNNIYMELQFPNDNENTIRIYTLENQLVHTQSFSGKFFGTVELSGLDKGIYIVEYYNNNQKQSKKITI